MLTQNQSLDEITDFYSSRYETPSYENFGNHLKNYFITEGQNFNQYLRSLGRNSKRIKGIKSRKLRKNAFMQYTAQGSDAYLVFNSTVDWDKSLEYLASEYDVSTQAKAIYLPMHEQAHLSQGKLRNRARKELINAGYRGQELRKELTKIVERDAESLVQNYASLMYAQTKNPIYQEIASIAELRLKEVCRNYE